MEATTGCQQGALLGRSNVITFDSVTDVLNGERSISSAVPSSFIFTSRHSFVPWAALHPIGAQCDHSIRWDYSTWHSCSYPFRNKATWESVLQQRKRSNRGKVVFFLSGRRKKDDGLTKWQEISDQLPQKLEHPLPETQSKFQTVRFSSVNCAGNDLKMKRAV